MESAQACDLKLSGTPRGWGHAKPADVDVDEGQWVTGLCMPKYPTTCGGYALHDEQGSSLCLFGTKFKSVLRWQPVFPGQDAFGQSNWPRCVQLCMLYYTLPHSDLCSLLRVVNDKVSA